MALRSDPSEPRGELCAGKRQLQQRLRWTEKIPPEKAGCPQTVSQSVCPDHAVLTKHVEPHGDNLPSK